MKVWLAPGASGGVESLAGAVAGLRRRGLEAEAIAVPQGRVEKAAQQFLEVARPEDVVAGQSYGGRAASLAAAEAPFAACVMFSFPLSGKPEARTAHWPRVACPALVLNGERDPMSPIADIRRLVPLLPRGRLVSFPTAGHGLRDALEAKLDAAAQFLLSL
ncbi:MAG TPA: alpha/beta family hydrolase [Candidatus Dormibacteraeota bacterium]